MTRNVARTVQRDVSDQMELIWELAQALEKLHKEAKDSGDQQRVAETEQMLANLNRLSKKAYQVGEAVLDAA